MLCFKFNNLVYTNSSFYLKLGSLGPLLLRRKMFDICFIYDLIGNKIGCSELLW